MDLDFEGLKTQIAKGELEKVMDELLASCKGSKFEEEVILLSFKYQDIVKKGRLSVTSSGEETLQINKIILAVLNLIKRLEEHFFSEVKPSILQFFETGRITVNKDERVYATQFQKDQVRYINWELHLIYPRIETRKPFQIDYIYYYPDGTEFGRAESNYSFEKGWTNSWHTNGWGWEKPGNWPQIGFYRVEILLNDKDLIDGGFTIT
jgi:hypothetical protein